MKFHTTLDFLILACNQTLDFNQCLFCVTVDFLVQQDSRLTSVLVEFLRDSRISSSCVLPDGRLDSVLDEFLHVSRPFSSCVQRQFSVDPCFNGSSDLSTFRVSSLDTSK